MLSSPDLSFAIAQLRVSSQGVCYVALAPDRIMRKFIRSIGN